MFPAAWRVFRPRVGQKKMVRKFPLRGKRKHAAAPVANNHGKGGEGHIFAEVGRP